MELNKSIKQVFEQDISDGSTSEYELQDDSFFDNYDNIANLEDFQSNSVSDGCANQLSDSDKSLKKRLLEQDEQNDVKGTKLPHMCSSRNENVTSTPKRNGNRNEASDAQVNISPIRTEKRISLLSRIKQKLKGNTSSVHSPLALKLRETSLRKALVDVQSIQEDMSQSDIGPFYGLPSKVELLFKTFRGIEKLYEWQEECLKLPAIRRKRQNLIYSLPTSGGKTLVAEILILRELLCHSKDAILVLPYISLVQEKVNGLAPFAVELDFIIEEYAASKGSIPPRKKRRRHTLYVGTMEKIHVLINSLVELDRIGEIGILVADELHMIGEIGGRGATYETLLTKVLYTSKRTQIIGMSATLSNIQDLQQFLRAEVYSKDFRPVDLREYVKVSNKLFEFKHIESSKPEFTRDLTFNYTAEMSMKDPDMVTGLVLEVIPQNSCLVFCPTKKHCENVANLLSQLLPAELKDYKKAEKNDLHKSFLMEGNGHMCSILTQTIKYGVAYHHSGLTFDERKLIEDAYSCGTLCCLICTSTLAVGVNLPAKRVILRAPYIGRDFITFSRYKQMIGRAGRAGIDSSGESILMIKPGEEPKVQALFTSNVDICNSCLMLEPCRLPMLSLSLIALGISSTIQDFHEFIDHTLAAVQFRQVDGTPKTLFCETVKVLVEQGLLTVCKNDTCRFEITKLGIATFKGNIDANNVEEICDDLRKGLRGLVLNSHLHLLFIVTPVELTEIVQFNSDNCFQRYLALSVDDQTAAELFGVTESLIMLMASGHSLKHEKKQLIHRFYLTLILYDLWLQNTIWSVSENYQLHRGVVQNLLASASSYGSTLVYFCQELDEFWAYQQLLPAFVKQLSYCSSVELIPLMELPAVKKSRARQLFLAGFKTISLIARSDPRDLVSKIEHLSHKVATQIVSTAKMMVLEKAEALQEEAELLFEDFNNSSIFNDIEL